MARKTWVLDTDTKGTGAQMVPLEKALEQKKPEPTAPARPKPAATEPQPAAPRRPKPEVKRTSSPLGPGQVRKKSTGEIGKIQSVDPKAGTATVQWLRQGRTSTVPLSDVTRK